MRNRKHICDVDTLTISQKSAHESRMVWMAWVEDAFFVLRMQPEQTGIEPAAAISAAVMSGLWHGFGAPALPTTVCAHVKDEVGRGWGWRGRSKRTELTDDRQLSDKTVYYPTVLYTTLEYCIIP